MSLTREQSTWHDQYENADTIIKETVDEAYLAVHKVLTDRGMSTAGDDRAEKLVAAIMEYLTDSAE